MADDIRDQAEKWLNDNVPAAMSIYSNQPGTAGKFTTITTLTHDGLIKQWKSQQSNPPGHRQVVTSCNSFAGEYSRAIYKVYLGSIDPHALLVKLKKEDAWVDASKQAPDVRPKKGDIVKGKGQHVFISLGFDPDEKGKWNTVQGGQAVIKFSPTPMPETKDGQPTGKQIWALDEANSYDAVKRSVRAGYDSSTLEGWIDLELFVGAATSASPVPPWLLGWWTVTWRSHVYYYYFDSNHQVQWTQVKPAITTQGVLLPSDTGSFTVEGNTGATIRWGATGSVETFSKTFVTADEQMQGTWNGTEPLTAEKM